MKNITFKKEEWVYTGRWITPTLALMMWLNPKKDPFKELNLRLSHERMYLDGHNFGSREDTEKVKDAANDSSFIREYSRLCEKHTLKVVSFAPKLREFRKQDRVKLLSEYNNAMRDLTALWNFQIPIADVVEEKFKMIRDYENIAKDMGMLKRTPLSDMHDEIIRFKEELKSKNLPLSMDGIRKAPTIYKKVMEHINRFEWYGSFNFMGTPYDEEGFIDLLNHTTDDKKMVPSGGVALDMSYMMWVRAFMVENASISDCAAEVLLSDIAKDLGAGFRDIIWLTIDEIAHCLEKGKKPDLKEIKERKKALGIYYRGGEEVILTGKELKKTLEQMMPESEVTDEVKGMVACRGKARGKAKVMVSSLGIEKFKKGYVLIAPETTPSYLPVMTKAAAIVTDQGGITSHAAIVSRELGIPCVIGTKIATKVFKDEDLVEVDAEKGIVRKINKSQNNKE